MADRGTVFSAVVTPVTPVVVSNWIVAATATVNWSTAIAKPSIPSPPSTKGQLWPRPNKS